MTTPTNTTLPDLPPALAAFFGTHADGTARCKRRAHETLGSLMTMCDEVAAHLASLSSQLVAAELETHDHALDPKLVWMHTRLDAATDRVRSFRAEGRALAHVLVEVERGFDTDHRNVARMLAGVQPTPPADVIA